MPGLTLQPVEVTDKDKRVTQALLAVCPGCGNDRFYAFQIKDETHFHLQCSLCDQTFCERGDDSHV